MLPIQFCSKYCKTYNHGCCDAKWTGLGLEVYCTCYCHNNKDNNLCLRTAANKVPTSIEKKVLQPIGDQAKTVGLTPLGEIPQ
jgi:hypothetical protein